MFEVLIVGSGPAGLYAAYNAGMRHLKACVIESLPYVGGQLTTLYRDKPIYDLPGHINITAGEFIDLLYTQFRRFEEDVPVYFDREMQHVDRVGDHFEVHTNKGILETKTIVLSTGGGTFEPRKLTCTGAEKQGVIYRVQDVSDFEGKNIIVLGGGDSALDWGNLVLKRGAISSTVVHRRDEFRAHESSIEKFKHHGTILANYSVEEVLGDDAVTGIRIKHNETAEEITLEADAIIVNYGFKPTKAFLADWDVERVDDAFLVHTTQETSIPGVFAIGNAATYDGKLKNISSGLGEATTCMGMINHILHPGKMKQFLK